MIQNDVDDVVFFGSKNKLEVSLISQSCISMCAPITIYIPSTLMYLLSGKEEQMRSLISDDFRDGA